MSRRSRPAYATVTREHIERLVQAGIDLLDALDAPREDLEAEEDADVEDINRIAALYADPRLIGSGDATDDDSAVDGDGLA